MMDYNHGTMYEFANDVFDEVVFKDSDLLDVYNGMDDDVAREELFDIVGFMLHDAEQAMYETAEKHRSKFVELLENRKAGGEA